MRTVCIPFVLSATLVLAQQTSVLFIGNSYTASNDLPNTFRQLALSLGDSVTVAMSAPGGYTLTDHVSYVPTLTAIDSQPWDFVVMQEQSQWGALPFDVTDMDVGALQLTEIIETTDECTYPVFYMTWGRKNGDALNCPNFPFMCTYAGMQQGLRENYIAVAEDNDAYVAPVGWAWKHVRDQYPDIELYVADESHPSAEGTYLAACTFYCTLFGESCVGATYNASLQPGTAEILRSIASSTVLDSTTTWNMDVPNGTDAGGWIIIASEPNAITYTHLGQGTHFWTCDNGQSFNTAQAAFTFGGPGIYNVTHIYNDPCGNSDTASLALEVYDTGITEGTNALVQVLAPGPSALEITGLTTAGTLNIHDHQGRVLVRRTITPGTRRISCPSGLHLWSVEEPSGQIWRGKVFVP
jgi:hypothetical protein